MRMCVLQFGTECVAACVAVRVAGCCRVCTSVWCHCCRLLQCALQCMLQHVLPLFKSSMLRAVRVAGCGAGCVNGESG